LPGADHVRLVVVRETRLEAEKHVLGRIKVHCPEVLLVQIEDFQQSKCVAVFKIGSYQVTFFFFNRLFTTEPRLLHPVEIVATDDI